jgi:hypothetical protein
MSEYGAKVKRARRLVARQRMLRTVHVLALAPTLVLASTGHGHAQQAARPFPRLMPLDPFAIAVGAQFGVVRMNPSVASSRGVGEFGAGLGLGASLTVYDVIGVSASAGLLLLDDRWEYAEQVVADGSSSPMTRNSLLEIGRHTLAIGPRTPALCLNEKDGRCMAVSAFAEFGKLWVNGQRRINNCVDCVDYSLHLRDGPFVALGLDMGTHPNDGTIGLVAAVTYRHAWPQVALSQELVVSVGAGF